MAKTRTKLTTTGRTKPLARVTEQARMDNINVAADEIIAIDLARASDLEDIANRFGLGPQMEMEISALRDPMRRAHRISQLSR